MNQLLGRRGKHKHAHSLNRHAFIWHPTSEVYFVDAVRRTGRFDFRARGLRN
jgi:hypothetical protein